MAAIPGNLLEIYDGGKSNTDLGQTGYSNFQSLTYNNTSFYVDTWWQQMYLGVGATNNALSSLANVGTNVMSDSTKKNMLAQAHALRALYISISYGSMVQYPRSPMYPRT